MTTGQPAEDYADVVGRLLIRVYEIHERVLAKGGGGEEAMRQAKGEAVQPRTIAQIAAWFKELVEEVP